MMALPKFGFVFLATTKTGSTAIENALVPHAQVAVRRPPELKHMTAHAFCRHVAPMLEGFGIPQNSYELMCLIREPVDFVASWWRYRSRPALVGTDRYTGEVSFDEYVDQVVSEQVRLGDAHRFVTDPDDGSVLVSTMFRYDHFDAATGWMAERIGVETLEIERANVSPTRDLVVARATRAKLEEYYADHLALYEAAR